MTAPIAAPRLLLIGCGKMGAALARGISKAQAGVIDGIDPNPLPADIAPLFSTSFTRLDDVAISVSNPYTAIILAVKPGQIADVCATLARHPTLCGPDTLIFSIAAGRTTTSIASAFSTSHFCPPIIRAMPNLPASVGMGITALCTSPGLSPDIRALGTTLARAMGDVVWIQDESLMDAVTALSGSGPAYLFLLIEAMTQAGETLGLAPDIAMALARQTVIGAAHLAAQSPDVSAKILRENVTSPGGTTAAALSVLMSADPGMTSIMTRAMTAARDRSRALSN